MRQDYSIRFSPLKSKVPSFISYLIDVFLGAVFTFLYHTVYKSIESFSSENVIKEIGIHFISFHYLTISHESLLTKNF